MCRTLTNSSEELVASKKRTVGAASLEAVVAFMTLLRCVGSDCIYIAGLNLLRAWSILVRICFEVLSHGPQRRKRHTVSGALVRSCSPAAVFQCCLVVGTRFPVCAGWSTLTYHTLQLLPGSRSPADAPLAIPRRQPAWHSCAG